MCAYWNDTVGKFFIVDNYFVIFQIYLSCFLPNWLFPQTRNKYVTSALNRKLKGVHSAVDQIQIQSLKEAKVHQTLEIKFLTSARSKKVNTVTNHFLKFLRLTHFLIGWLVLSIHFLPVKLKQKNNIV